MFTKSFTVIIIFRKKLIACRVKPGTRREIRDVREFGWDENTLEIVLSKIKSLYKVDTVRMLLTREVSYVLRMTIPKELELSDKRQYIVEKLSERIPEQVGVNDFDFAQIGESTANDENILVFAPIAELTTTLKKSTAGLTIEAAEPEELAKTRDANPIIGIALKGDLRGKDEHVLNLQFSRDGKMESPANPRKKLYILIFFLCFVASAILIYSLIEFNVITTLLRNGG